MAMIDNLPSCSSFRDNKRGDQSRSKLAFLPNTLLSLCARSAPSLASSLRCHVLCFVRGVADLHNKICACGAPHLQPQR